jgi:hypothetical protein
MNCPYCQTELFPYGTDTFRCYSCGDSIFWVKGDGKIEAIAIGCVMVDNNQFAVYMDISRNPAGPVTTASKYNNKLRAREVVLNLQFVPDNWTPTTLPNKLKLYLWLL